MANWPVDMTEVGKFWGEAIASGNYYKPTGSVSSVNNFLQERKEMFGGLTDDPFEAELLGSTPLAAPSNMPTTTVPQVSVGGLATNITGALTNFTGSLGGNVLGYGALAFGAYRAFRSRRVNLLTLGLMIYGLWSIGVIPLTLLPRNSDGSINFIALGLAVILPPTAAALVAGVPGIIISTLARGLFKRRRRFTRRFRSYRPRRRWSNYRRRYTRR